MSNKDKLIEYYRINIVPKYQKLLKEDVKYEINSYYNRDLLVTLQRWAKKQEINLEERRQLMIELNRTESYIVKEKLREDLRKVNDRLKRIENQIKKINKEIKNKEK